MKRMPTFLPKFRSYHERMLDRLAQYVRKSGVRIELFAVCAAGMFLLLRMPYVNLVLTPEIAVTFVMLVGIGILRIPMGNALLLPILFAAAYLFTLFGMTEMADNTGVVIYVLIWIEAIRIMGKIMKEQ